MLVLRRLQEICDSGQVNNMKSPFLEKRGYRLQICKTDSRIVVTMMIRLFEFLISIIEILEMSTFSTFHNA